MMQSQGIEVCNNCLISFEVLSLVGVQALFGFLVNPCATVNRQSLLQTVDGTCEALTLISLRHPCIATRCDAAHNGHHGFCCVIDTVCLVGEVTKTV